jgi:hypothetical protein
MREISVKKEISVKEIVAKNEELGKKSNKTQSKKEAILFLSNTISIP